MTGSTTRSQTATGTGTAAMSLGASDMTLLVVSMVGFLCLGLLFYLSIFRGLRASSEEEKDSVSYEDELDAADVKTLNRAQRRARAKILMKRNRRVAAPVAVVADPDAAADVNVDEHAEELLDILEDDHANEGDEQQQQQQQHLSRKERSKVAKAMEREERRRYEETRREQLRKADDGEAKEAREAEKARKEEHARQKLLQEQLDLEEAKRLQYRTMFRTAHINVPQKTLLVEDFVALCEAQRVINLDDMACQFDISIEHVIKRIEQIEEEGRITGIIDEHTFIYVSPTEMSAIANFCHRNGKVTVTEIAKECNRLLNLNIEMSSSAT
eukprot:CAMPEP_0198291876 /NCGR_PEP_ID=MMETSP1449-20131203/9242_1 /TAXON_ID=420275 /ORGANISM="Attheya septentrionalis, Strain CCMP2084" /LENGTH=327 /DNA_ID=CAMNT_0043990561 /DNA_START=85 /DNA_END=1068 /DNA_ORIENTATION=+